MGNNLDGSGMNIHPIHLRRSRREERISSYESKAKQPLCLGIPLAHFLNWTANQINTTQAKLLSLPDPVGNSQNTKVPCF